MKGIASLAARLGASCWLATVAVAQQPPVVITGASVSLTAPARAIRATPATLTRTVNAPGELVILEDEAGDAVNDPKTTPAKSARAQKFATVEFDRRPSTILKTWAEPPPKPAPKPPEAVSSRSAGGASLATALREEAARGGSETAPTPSAEPESRASSQPAEPAEPAALAASAPASRTASRAASRATSRLVARAASLPTSRAAPPAPAAVDTAAETQAIEAEIAAWKRAVTLGRWNEVAAYLRGLPPEDAKIGYERMLKSLAEVPRATRPINPSVQSFAERNRIDLADLVGLVDAAPCALEKSLTGDLGRLLRACCDAGGRLETVLAALAPRIDATGSRLDRRGVARMLAAAGELIAAGDYLVSVDEAEAKNDREGLNLWARHFLVQHERDAKPEWLERAWRVTQAALAQGIVDEEEKADALGRAVDLAPRLKAELGAAWLDESFAARPERGMEVLASIGGAAAGGLFDTPNDPAPRKKWLELQRTAAAALQRAAPERAKEWGPILAVLAGNWLKEAQLTYQFDEDASLNPRMQRDMYGNFYYGGGSFRGNQNRPQPIKTAEVLELRPDDAWLAFVDDAMRPKFHFTVAQLLLKAGEPEEAYPYVAAMATSHPSAARDLANEFLQVWAKNHDPNRNQNRTNPYIFVYGFEERASGIPLTRSKQERNLKDLSAWTAKLRELSVELDEAALVKCFTTAHGTAEIYRLETIETVFGPLKELKPSVLGTLAEGMRQNLATVWRDAAVQERGRTKRKKQDIEAEVLRGYELSRRVLTQALAAHPQSFELKLAEAAFRHDENVYRAGLKKDSGFQQRRAEAFAGFRAAADLYRAALDAGLPVEKETLAPYERWFYAALGACDLGALTHEQSPSLEQVAAVKAALAELGGERARRHQDMFATALFSRIGSVKPAVKFRYLREGLAVAGENKLCREAASLYEYYRDLVTEVRLVAEIEGASTVGHTTPFGLRVSLVHTREIERESGGFGKYLQNQNSMSYAWNYGRPTEDYRDKFEEAARSALGERFEVLSVTFNHAEAKSLPAEELGWRVTPYAYLLLKPKGPEVDRIPSLRLDLDFLDTSGYAVLPVESPVLAIDATDAAGPLRPYSGLKLVATVDERSAKDGKLLYELKATARGVVPEAAVLIDPSFPGFEIVKRDEGPVSVVKFDEEGDGREAVTERLFTFTLKPTGDRDGATGVFRFPSPKVTDAVIERFRYEDADLVPAPESFELGKKLRGGGNGMWIAIGLAAAATLAATWFFLRKSRRPGSVAGPTFGPPSNLTPFTVLDFLRALESRPEGARHATELRAEIARIEAFYFGGEGAEPDLAGSARSWAAKAGLV